MKHAGNEALDKLADLLAALRKIEGLQEKKRGVFYLKSSAFLHFHEDPQGLFADIHDSPRWDRMPVSTKAQRDAVRSRVRSALKLRGP